MRFIKFSHNLKNILHRAVVPEKLISKIIGIAHLFHTGYNETLENIREGFIWKCMIAYVTKFE